MPKPRASSTFPAAWRSLILGVVCAALATACLAQRGNDSGRASKNGKTIGSIDGVEVVLEYGRPKVKDRAIWGGVVPWNEVWRTGADEATTFTVSAPVLVEGKALPAGTYGLFTIPGESEWTVIFNSEARQWGAYDYKAEKDVLRVAVKPVAVDQADAVEELDFVIEGSQVVLRWERVKVPFSVRKGG